MKTKVPLISFDHRKASDVLTKRKTALLGALLSATLVVGLGLVAAPAANAAAGDSKISVNVGSYRTTNGSVAPGTGAVLGLSYATSSNGSWTDASATSWGKCTVASTSACTFTIPKGEQNSSRVFRVSILTPQSGYSAIDTLAVGSDSKSTVAYLTEFGSSEINSGKFGTKVIDLGISYSSSKKFREKSTVSSSQGVWAMRGANPALANACGLKVGMLVDLSSSMKSSLTSLKTAAKTFINSLTDTSSTMSIFTFSKGSPAPGVGATTTASLATSQGVQSLKSAVDNLVVLDDQGTNWDAGLRAVTAANLGLDVLLVLSDGQPTYHYTNASSNTIGGNGSTATFATIEGTIYSSNALKRLGTRVQIVGIGSGLSSIVSNLGAVSDNAGAYSVISDYSALAAKLKEFTDKQCQGTITVLKKTVEFQKDSSTAVVTKGATFGASMTGGTLASTSLATNDDGVATFKWTSNSSADASATITEAGSANYTIRPNQDGTIAKCVVAGGSGSTVAVTNSPTNENAFSIKAPKNSAITCTVINEKQPPAASIKVVKNWTINGQAYTSAQTLPIAVTSAATEGTTVRPYDTTFTGRKQGDSVTIVDTNTQIPSGLKCTYDAPTGSLAVPQTKTLAAGLNTFTFAATITCKTTLAASHTVTNGGMPAADWKVTATPSSPAISGNGSFPVTAVPGNTSYTLAATNTAPYAQAYVQKAWTCTVNGVTTTLGAGNSVSTPMGTDTVCATSSNTSVVTLTKKVKAVTGSTVVPSDWTLNISPVVKDSTPATSVAGSATGATLLVRPNTEFTLGETITKASDTALAQRFVLDNLECATGSGTARTVALNAVHSVAAQDSLNCTFTNAEFGLKIKKTAWNGTLAVGVDTSALIAIPSGSALPLPSGATVSWTYDVTNTGVLPMKITNLVDDQNVAIECGPLALTSALAPDATIRCVGTARLP